MMYLVFSFHILLRYIHSSNDTWTFIEEAVVASSVALELRYGPDLFVPEQSAYVHHQVSFQ